MSRLIPLILGTAVLAGCGVPPAPMARLTVPQPVPQVQTQGLTTVQSADVAISLATRTVTSSSGQKIVWDVTTHAFQWVEVVKGMGWPIKRQKQIEIHETTIPGTNTTHVKYFEDGLQLSDPAVDNGPYKRLLAHYDKMALHVHATKRDKLHEIRLRFQAYSQWNGAPVQPRR